MVKILEKLRDFEITASGGYAIYILICTLFVTVLGSIGIVKSVYDLFI